MTSTSDHVLQGLPLFAGLELAELAGLLGTIDLAAGEGAWRQGQPADALYVVETGSLAVAARLPGERDHTLATLGAHEVLGEPALLDGGVRTASVRALEPTRLLRLGRADFRALVSRRDDSARTLRRRLTDLACTRLRERHRALASTLPGALSASTAVRGEAASPPEAAYLLRLPFFRDYDATDLEAFLGSVSVERVERGALLVAEGEPARALFVTLNGAVEEAIRRDGSAIRVALAGPGRGFGYAGLIAGGEATAAAAARERSVVLVISPAELEAQLGIESFAAAVERDVVAALRQAERPQARLAAGHVSGDRPANA